MAFGKLERKDLDPEFLSYLDEKWEKYEYAKKTAEQLYGTTERLYWVNRAYSYKFDYDVAMYEYEGRVKRSGGPKLTES